jgi:hypothetical protein
VTRWGADEALLHLPQELCAQMFNLALSEVDAPRRIKQCEPDRSVVVERPSIPPD